MDIAKVVKKQFPTLILLLGKSKSGKSYLIKWLIRQYTQKIHHFQYGLVLTGSYYNHEYEYLPSHAVHEYKAEILDTYINNLKQKKTEGNGKPLPASFLVLDDCLGLITKTPAWQNLLSTYRHLNITLFLSVQYLKSESSSTLVREQTGVLFAFKSTNVNVIKCLYDYYASEVFENFEDFKERYLECCQKKHCCCVYVNDDMLAKPNKNFLRFKCPTYADYKLKY